MEREEEVFLDETVLGGEEVEPFDWEDHLYETMSLQLLIHSSARPTDL